MRRDSEGGGICFVLLFCGVKREKEGVWVV